MTAEVAPQHSKTESLLLTKGSNAKIDPPLQQESDRLAVIEGLKSGVISVIATTRLTMRMRKRYPDITKAPSGMTGLETSLSWFDLLGACWPFKLDAIA